MSKPTSTTDGSSDRRINTQFPKDWNYEATVAKVEGIIRQIEAGKLELADVFEEFTAAVEYLRQCEIFLQERQQQMNLLIETLADEPTSF
ncbi:MULTISPECIES: exodeoxyribonuclease VII small subunit [unclassified Coleofasciculus]|uniref:exodeoxyribonuclease VII small subunit n=1 Tax=Cyanophyceae TaxID=3028117 RepID=UPI0016858510|nr:MULTISPECIES: exodeoxyribonuclease VII small subunit [unclassified Coleofasciculus]MBD1881618.1 exodeoxyribonuclease VII small subunit [Coleofasciculus sp. FACHB-T130]MBD1889072.1 exodeoxyribonuclease VII small subunit [Coleofasciculus sp. FACHB-SPT9]MBD2087868.1 exodeoxyribonuclease VII small subunit [Coleofasciculus sp. FACHB-542]